MQSPVQVPNHNKENNQDRKYQKYSTEALFQWPSSQIYLGMSQLPTF